MADEVQQPPDGLRARGLRLWESTTADMVLDPDELVLLEEACRVADEIDTLWAALGEQGPLTKGSRGQQVASPLLREIRGHRLVLSRILRQLGATNPGDEESGERLSPSERGRKAAIARHHGARSLPRPRQVWPPSRGSAS